jgi:(E)-4-hydroxy-3-methyl-but-2-enyl pyrophosphate reductase
MKIELAKHSGFCAGVKDAVGKIVEEINSCGEDIFIQGQLIHSPQTVKILEKRGLKIIKESDSVNNKITAIRTHGTTLQEYQNIKKYAKRVINLTCPNVAYVQGIVKKYSSRGYFVLILGDKNHAEVIGISSYASTGFYIISSLEDITTVPAAEKYVLVSQTTLDMDFFNKAAAILQKELAGIEIIDTICSATSDRQNDLHNAVKRGVDAIVVVGGKNSANTQRLAQIGTDNKIKTFHIEAENELMTDDFAGVKHVVVSAGASTPSWIVNNVLEKLYEINYKSKKNRMFYILKSFLEFLIRTNLFSALITIFMTASILPCKIYECDMTMPFLSAAFIFIMYSINNFLRPYEAQLSKPFKYNLYSRHKYLLLVMTAAALVYFLVFSMHGKYPAFALYLIAFVCGFIYAIPMVTKIVSSMRNKFLRILFGVKSIITSGAWAFIALVIPFTVAPHDHLQFIALSIIIFSIIFIRNFLIDLADYQGDLLLGIETVITIFGFKITRIIIIILCLFYFSSVIYHIIFINKLAVLFLINMVYYYYLYKKIKKNYYFYRFKYELLIDLNLLFYAVFSTAGDYLVL